MGVETNARWMHSVHTDKRLEIKDPAERGPRIQPHLPSHWAPSSPSSHRLPRALQNKCNSSFSHKAQRAKHAQRHDPSYTVARKAKRLLVAFGAENDQSEFDWENAYGEGSDVLHFTTSTPVSA